MRLQRADFLAGQHPVGEERQAEIVIPRDLKTLRHQIGADTRFRRQRHIPEFRFGIGGLAGNLLERHAERQKDLFLRIRRFPGSVSQGVPDRQVHLLVHLRHALEEQPVQPVLVQARGNFLFLEDIDGGVGTANRAGIVGIGALAVHVRAAHAVGQFRLAQQVTVAFIRIILLLADPVEPVLVAQMRTPMAPQAPFQFFDRSESAPVRTYVDDDASVLARRRAQPASDRLAPQHLGKRRPEMDDDVAMRVVPALGEHADRYHRLDSAALMLRQQRHAFVDRRPGRYDRRRDAGLANLPQGRFGDADIGAEPGGDRRCFKLFPFLQIAPDRILDHRRFDDRRRQLRDGEVA